MKHLLIPLLCSWTLLLYSCKKGGEPDPMSQLPPETQIGANTFGCLVNGVPWTPKGNAGGFSSNFSPVLEANGDGGYDFGIATYRIDSNVNQGLGLGVVNLSKVGTYYLSFPNGGVQFDDVNTLCSYLLTSDGIYQNSKIEITKFDMTNYIVSGRFEATLKVPDCDTIKITNGRFDVKFN